MFYFLEYTVKSQRVKLMKNFNIFTARDTANGHTWNKNSYIKKNEKFYQYTFNECIDN